MRELSQGQSRALVFLFFAHILDAKLRIEPHREEQAFHIRTKSESIAPEQFLIDFSTPLNSRDRMLASALNFAIGFFSYPFQGQYEQSITIEGTGVREYLSDTPPCSSLSTLQFNNTLAPYNTCFVSENANTNSQLISLISGF